MSKKFRKAGTSKEKEEEEFEPGSWECTVCTYRNNFEAFKCEMCDTRKGTSTRKPRLNYNVVQQQTLVQNLAVQNERSIKRQRNGDSRSRYSPESNFSTASRALNASSSGSCQQRDNSSASHNIDARLVRRRVIPFSDALVERANSCQCAITINDKTYTITEFSARSPERA